MSHDKETLIHTAVAAAGDANDASQQASELERRFQALSRAHAPPRQLADVAGAVARAVEESSRAQRRAADASQALSEALPDGMTVTQWLDQEEAPS